MVDLTKTVKIIITTII